MASPEFSPEQLAILVSAVQKHVAAEHDLELGRFEAEELLDFFARQIGPHFYNRGLTDAQVVVAKQFDAINDALYQLERPVGR